MRNLRQALGSVNGPRRSPTVTGDRPRSPTVARGSEFEVQIRQVKTDICANAALNAALAVTSTDAATVFAEQESPDGFYDFDCPPLTSLSGHLWGTEVYTDDSHICEAAVHAGATVMAVGGPVRFEKLPGQESYMGSVRNGVSSWDWGVWGQSFSFVP